MFFILDSSFKRFENSTVKWSAKETKWTSLEAKTHPTFLENLISKYDFGPVKLPGLSRVDRQTDMFLFGVLYKDIDISRIIELHSEADRFSLRSTDCLTLKKKYARTNVLKYSFFHRIIDQWNQLPLDIHVSDDVNIFKTRVKKFLGDF